MITVLKFAACAVIGYLLGNFTTGTYVSKLFSVDIRRVGSGNIGTTNVLRALGWLPSFMTFVGDVLKGALAAYIGFLIAGDIGARVGGVCAVAGHNWPVFSHFKGGKGIATSLGLILVIEPWFGLGCVIVEALVVVLTGYMSLASLSAAGFYLLITLITRWYNPAYVIFALPITIMAFICHRENIKRLKNGTENKLDINKINKAGRDRKR